jgi:protein phosphatase 1D
MADDAEEEPDEKNPFALDAEPLNEASYADDPKKTLRGWFEREGLDLEYECTEKGYATFHCTVSLPLEEGTVVAEATVKGKKKEAVAQCALEACRLLDRRGVLRQSNHESR